MKKMAVFIAVVLLLVLGAAPALAASGIPALPHAFYGSVIVNGAPASDGTRVSATVDSGSVITNAQNPVTTSGGSYGVNSSFLLVQGDITPGATITFYVDGIEVEGVTATFEAGGGPTQVDLSATIPGSPGGGGGGGGGDGGGGDTTPPIISNVLVSSITETSADISWETDENSNSQVEYWASPSKCSPLDEAMCCEHLVCLSDLTQGTTYCFRVMSADSAGNLAVSAEYTFNTLGKAAFTTSDLSVSPSEVYVGETVAITMVVTNSGDGTGSYKVVLKINGVVEATKDITLNADAGKEVAFTTARDVAGSYSVEVDGLRASFTVREKPLPAAVPPPEEVPSTKPPINWPLIGGIIAGVVIVGLLIFFRTRRRTA